MDNISINYITLNHKVPTKNAVYEVAKCPLMWFCHLGHFPSYSLCHASSLHSGDRDTCFLPAHHPYLLLLEWSSKFTQRNHHSPILSLYGLGGDDLQTLVPSVDTGSKMDNGSKP